MQAISAAAGHQTVIEQPTAPDAVAGRGSSVSRTSRVSALTATPSTRSEASPSVSGREIPDPSLRLHAGWLIKKGEGLVSRSQHRFFVLYRNLEIHYFESDTVLERRTHKGVIVVAGLSRSDFARVHADSASDYSFTLNTPKRRWHLKPASKQFYEGWHEALTAILKA